jgi:hypothetical protein
MDIAYGTPTSPRCATIIDVHQRRDRRSISIAISSNKSCQTELTCLKDTDDVMQCEHIPNVTIRHSHDRSRVERQIQVNTLDKRVNDLTQVRIERTDRSQIDSTCQMINDDAILTALIDNDGSCRLFAKIIVHRQTNELYLKDNDGRNSFEN